MQDIAGKLRRGLCVCTQFDEDQSDYRFAGSESVRGESLVSLLFHRSRSEDVGVRPAASGSSRSDGPRVATLLWQDAMHPAAISGMPWNMCSALNRQGCDVVPIVIGRSDAAVVVGAGRVFGRSDRVRGLARGSIRAFEAACPEFARARHLHRARRLAARADRLLRDHAVDAVFGPCMSAPLAWLQSDLPVVYASDATASLLLSSYDEYRRRGCGWREAMLEMETRALGRADRVALASANTARSAVEDHGMDPSKVTIVPLGANVRPRPGERVSLPSPPNRDDLRLLLSAADPERKRLDLCVEIVRGLRARGTTATLHYIGPHRPAVRTPEVVWEGHLRLGNPVDDATHRRLLAETHLSILPSAAEMYGIAPIESAAYSRPAVVSDAGGLPTVVQDLRTGRVVPREAPVSAWIEAVEDVCGDPGRYLAYGQAARGRFESELNWDSWGRRVRSLVEDAVARVS